MGNGMILIGHAGSSCSGGRVVAKMSGWIGIGRSLCRKEREGSVVSRMVTEVDYPRGFPK